MDKIWKFSFQSQVKRRLKRVRKSEPGCYRSKNSFITNFFALKYKSLSSLFKHWFQIPVETFTKSHFVTSSYQQNNPQKSKKKKLFSFSPKNSLFNTLFSLIFPNPNLIPYIFFCMCWMLCLLYNMRVEEASI